MVSMSAGVRLLGSLGTLGLCGHHAVGLALRVDVGEEGGEVGSGRQGGEFAGRVRW